MYCIRIVRSQEPTLSKHPDNLLILPLPRFHLQRSLIHLMHVPGGLHITQYVLLQLRHGLEGIRHVLVLLDVSDDLCGLSALREVDECGFLDDGGDAVFDER